MASVGGRKKRIWGAARQQPGQLSEQEPLMGGPITMAVFVLCSNSLEVHCDPKPTKVASHQAPESDPFTVPVNKL